MSYPPCSVPAFLPWGQRLCVNILRAKDGEPGDEAIPQHHAAC